MSQLVDIEDKKYFNKLFTKNTKWKKIKSIEVLVKIEDITKIKYYKLLN